MRRFRVVVIDDDAEVLRRVPGRLSRTERKFGSTIWQIDLATVRVELEKDNRNSYVFTKGTLDRLGQAVSLKPDALFFDYVYIEREVLAYWLNSESERHAITPNDLAGQFLTPVELASAVEQLIQEGGTDSALRQALRRNFLGFKGPIFLYTMTLKPFLPVFGQPEFRASRIDTAFKRKSAVKIIDTNYELYNREYAEQKHDPSFYAHLVGGLIDKNIQIALLETMLERAKNLRYLRYPRSMVAVGAIVAIGGGIAAVAEFLGSNVGDLLRTGDYQQAIIAAGFAILVAFLVGALLPFAFGRFMSGLLGRSEKREPDQEFDSL